MGDTATRRDTRTLTWLIVGSWVVIVGAIVSATWVTIGIWTATWPVPVGVQQWWPRISAPQTETLLPPTSGGFTVGEFVVPGISTEVLLDTTFGVLLQAALVVVAAAIVLRLSTRLHDGKGLAGTAGDVGVLGLAVLVCGILWQVAFGMAAIVGGREVFGSGIELENAYPWPSGATELGIDLWPVPVAAALGAAALAFRYAERVERSAEGLV